MAIPDVKTNSKKRRASGDALLIALLVAGGAIIVCLRLFVFQPFSIPSGSMVPTLIPGDYVLVSKISYGYGPYSLPLATAGLSHRIPASWLPERGDVVVFRVTGKTAVDFIKRVAGRPGDRVQMTKGVLSINGVAVPRQRIGGTTVEGSNQHGTRYRETLPSGVSYLTLSLNDNGIYANTPEYIVPPGHYLRARRQPRQFGRQPYARSGRLRSGREHDRPRRTYRVFKPERRALGPGLSGRSLVAAKTARGIRPASCQPAGRRRGAAVPPGGTRIAPRSF